MVTIAKTTTKRLIINVDTFAPIVPGDSWRAAPTDEGHHGWDGPRPPALEPQHRPGDRRRTWLLVLPSVVLLAAVAAIFVRLPYDLVAPGRSLRVNDLVSVKGAPTFPARGTVVYPTVSLRERINVYEMAIGWLDRDIRVEPERRIRGSIPPEQFEQLNQELMSESKRSAELVVLSRLGHRVARGAEIVGVEPSFPASSVLQRGDVVTAIDGKPVGLADDLVAMVRARRRGDRVKLAVVRDGRPRDVEAVLGGSGDRTMLGVRVTTKVELPFEVNIDSGQVGGPSAGLAYALQLHDLLTPGELTGGRTVAATGELGVNGDVLPVGGVAQKTISVRHAGAKLFLVPKDNLAEARAHRGKNLSVVAVEDFDEALRLLNRSNGDKAPSR